MTQKILVEYRGHLVTLTELAELTSIKRDTLWSRYVKGIRGDALVGPLRSRGGGRPIGSGRPNLEVSKGERQRLEHEARMQKQAERKASADAMRATHAALFSRPLISESLLTERERRQIRERVMFSAQRQWSVKGVSR